ncbi:GIY-YIG nuclease family protein [Roseibium album]|uniref:GIY-YIG nuclease family protein n=1 Tax=Roseibium album TaxID=311410 RepID=UPI003BAEF523
MSARRIEIKNDEETMEKLRKMQDLILSGLPEVQFNKPDPLQVSEPEYVEYTDRFGRHKKRLPNQLYFIKCGEFVKIGITSDIRKRLGEIKNGNPHDLELLHITAGKRNEERALHIRFSKFRHRDEWFRFEGELKAFIEDLTKA